MREGKPARQTGGEKGLDRVPRGTGAASVGLHRSVETPYPPQKTARLCGRAIYDFRLVMSYELRTENGERENTVLPFSVLHAATPPPQAAAGQRLYDAGASHVAGGQRLCDAGASHVAGGQRLYDAEAITEGVLTPITRCDTWTGCITACL